MSTSFSEIIKLINLEMSKADIFKNNTDIALDKLSDYILIGSNVDFTTCRKDLNKYIPFSKVENKYTISIDCSSYTIDLSTIQDNLRDDIVLYINDKEVNEYDYKYVIDGNNGKIIYEFSSGDEVEVINIFEGEFEEDLSFKEKYIIALASYYHYVNSLVIKEQQIYNKLGDKDYSVVKGNTFKELIDISNNIKEKLRQYIKEYDDYISTVEEMM